MKLYWRIKRKGKWSWKAAPRTFDHDRTCAICGEENPYPFSHVGGMRAKLCYPGCTHQVYGEEEE